MSNTQDQSSSHFDVDENDHEYFASTVEVIDLGRDPVTGLAIEPAHAFDIVWNLDLNANLSGVKAPYVIDINEQPHAPGTVDPSKYIYLLGSSSNVIQIELAQTLTESNITSLVYTDDNGTRTGSGANEVECMAHLATQMSTDGSTVTLLATDGSQDVTSSITPHKIAMASSGVGNSLEVGGANDSINVYDNFSLTSLPSGDPQFRTLINGSIVLAWRGGSLHRSTDGGLTFTDITANLSGHSVGPASLAYSSKSNLYVALSSDRVTSLTSSDGLTWTTHAINLPSQLYPNNHIEYSSTTDSFWVSGMKYTTTDGITFTEKTNTLGAGSHSPPWGRITDSSTSLFNVHKQTIDGVSSEKIIKYNSESDDWEVVYDAGDVFRTLDYNPVTNRLIATTSTRETIYSSDDGATFTRLLNYSGTVFDNFVWAPGISLFVGVSSVSTNTIYYTSDCITFDIGTVPETARGGYISASADTLLVTRENAIAVSSTVSSLSVASGQSTAITGFMTNLKSQTGAHQWYGADANNPQSAPVQVKNGLAQLFDRDPQLNNLIGSAATASTFIDVAKVQDKMQNAADTFYTKLFSEQQLREVLEAVADKGSRISGTGPNRTFNFTAGDSITAVVKVRDSDSNNTNTDRWLVTLQQV